MPHVLKALEAEAQDLRVERWSDGSIRVKVRHECLTFDEPNMMVHWLETLIRLWRLVRLDEGETPTEPHPDGDYA